MDYTSSIERVKKTIMDPHFDAAIEHVHKAISLGPSYEPAIKNLQRSTEGRWRQTGDILLGDAQKHEK